MCDIRFPIYFTGGGQGVTDAVNWARLISSDEVPSIGVSTVVSPVPTPPTQLG